MELLRELFTDFLKSEHFEIKLARSFDWESVVEKKCYVLLTKIREIIRDDQLDDPACFAKIEEIVCLFEDAGIDCGARHDF